MQLKTKILISYCAIMIVLLFIAIWLSCAFTLKNKIENKLIYNSKIITLFYEKQNIKVAGFPYYFKILIKNPQLCLIHVEKCFNAEKIKIKSNFFINRISSNIENITEQKEPELQKNNSAVTNDIQIKVNFKQSLLLQSMRGKPLDFVKNAQNISMTIESDSKRDMEDNVLIQITANREKLNENLNGWHGAMEGRLSTGTIHATLYESFKKFNNFYLDLEKFTYISNDYDIELEGVVAVYGKKNDIKLLLNTNNAEYFLNNLLQKINNLSIKPAAMKEASDKIILDLYKKKILNEITTLNNRQIIKINSYNNTIFIGKSSVNDLINEVINDYTKTIPQR